MLEQDARWMGLALAEAEKGRGHVEPNPLVGAVVVRDDQQLAAGYHARFGGQHAEAAALAGLGEQARGATLYVTLEPCCHHGKTPPCAEAILAAGISRVVAAVRDPFPRVDGGGLARLRAAGVQVDLGLRAGEAVDQNAAYLKRVTTGVPYVIAKWAMTLDGKTATAGGESRWISSEGSRARVHELRGRMDAIAVGIGTALADNPTLTARPPGPRTPLRIVVDSRARLPLDGNLARTARRFPVLVAIAAAAPDDRCEALRAEGCEVLKFSQNRAVPVEELLAELGRRGMTNMLIEGGGRLLGSFLDRGLIDEVDVFIAPVLEGGDHANTSVRGRGVSVMTDALRLSRGMVEESDGDVRFRGKVPQPWRSSLSALGIDRS